MPANLPENEQNQQAPQGTTTPNPIGNLPPVTTGGSSGQASGGTAGGTNPSATASSNQFAPSATKLSDYLATNKDQAGAQGTAIAGQLNQGFTQTQADINKAMQGFDQQVGQGYTPVDTPQYGFTVEGESLAPTSGFNSVTANQAALNPSEFVKDQGNITKFQNLWNDEYKGPQNFESTTPYQNVQNEVQTAVSNASNLTNPAGLQSYLNSQAKGNYLPGMATLDTALVQGSPDANKAIQDAAKPYAGLNDYLTGQVSQANAQVPVAQQAATDAQNAVRNQFTGAGGVLPTYKSNLQNQTTAAQQKAQSAIDAEKSFLGNGNNWQGLGGNPQQLADLGLTLPQYYNLLTEQGYIQQNGGQGATVPAWNQYFNAVNPTVDINQGNVATPQQYSDIAALQKLTGQDLSSYLNPANSSQAGTAPKNPYSLNYGQMNTDLQNLINGITPGAAQTQTTSSPSSPDLTEPAMGVLAPITIGMPETVKAIGNNLGTQGPGGSINPVLPGIPLDTIGNTATDAGNAVGNISSGTGGSINPILPGIPLSGTLNTVGNTINDVFGGGGSSQAETDNLLRQYPWLGQPSDVKNAPFYDAKNNTWTEGGNSVTLDQIKADHPELFKNTVRAF